MSQKSACQTVYIPHIKDTTRFYHVMSKLSHIKDTTKPIIIYVCVEQILIKKDSSASKCTRFKSFHGKFCNALHLDVSYIAFMGT